MTNPYYFQNEGFDRLMREFFEATATERVKPVEITQREYIIRAAKTCIELGADHPEVRKVLAKLQERANETVSNATVWYRINLLAQGNLNH